MSVWLPQWSIDLVHRRDRRSREDPTDPRPLLLFEQLHQQQVVARCCPRARAAGVRRGMPITQARALFADPVRIQPLTPERDAAALRALAEWAHKLSPVVALDAPDGLLIDVTGCEAVYRGETRLVKHTIAQFAKLGVRARAAVAPTYACARAIARFWRKPAAIVLPGRQREALAPLPIAALNPSPQALLGLAEVGIERIGQLLDLPRSTLPARFGDDLLLHLDRALGQGIETIQPVRPVPPPDVERVFEGPTDRVEAIELTVRDLLEEISRELLARESGARVLEVELARSDLAPERLTITLGRPSRDPRHLWKLLAPKLEKAHLGFGVEGVRLRIPSLGLLKHEQAEHWLAGRTQPARETQRARDELLDTLSNRLGHERVLRFVVRESHTPERAFAERPMNAGSECAAPAFPAKRPGVRKAKPRTPGRAAGDSPRAEPHAGIDDLAPTSTPASAPHTTPHDRPTLLFGRPLPADVVSLTPDGPVHRIRWRGGDHAVIASRGPERISEEWWRPDAQGSSYTPAPTQNATTQSTPTIPNSIPAAHSLCGCGPSPPRPRATPHATPHARIDTPAPPRAVRTRPDATPTHARTESVHARITPDVVHADDTRPDNTHTSSTHASLSPHDLLPSPSPARDYYAAQCDDGRWIWLARGVETGRWFVHGVWT